MHGAASMRQRRAVENLQRAVCMTRGGRVRAAEGAVLMGDRSMLGLAQAVTTPTSERVLRGQSGARVLRFSASLRTRTALVRLADRFPLRVGLLGGSERRTRGLLLEIAGQGERWGRARARSPRSAPFGYPGRTDPPEWSTRGAPGASTSRPIARWAAKDACVAGALPLSSCRRCWKSWTTRGAAGRPTHAALELALVTGRNSPSRMVERQLRAPAR